MPDSNNAGGMHMILGAALLLIAVFVVIALVMINSQAEDASVTVTNQAPVVNTIFLTDANSTTFTHGYSGAGGTINNLVQASTRNIFVNGRITDDNGEGDIASVTGSFRRSSIADADCDEASETDNNTCYYDATCNKNLGAGNAQQLDYSCQFAIQFYADSTITGGVAAGETWTTLVTANDGQGDVTNTLTNEMGLLAALDPADTIAWGSLAPNTTTTAANDVEQSIEQEGNDVADIRVKMLADDMTCTVRGTIPRANIRWALTEGVLWASATALTDTEVDTDIAIGYRTDDGAALTDTLYWDIFVPLGTEGSCTSTLVMDAIAA